MALHDIDKRILELCLEHKPRAWEVFVNRFMGLVLHVITHTAHSRSLRLTDADREDLCAEVFLRIIKNDFAVLRNFRGQSSLSTYLTVVARRVVVRELLKRKISPSRLVETMVEVAQPLASPHVDIEQRIEDREEVERMLDDLDAGEARVVRMFHLDGQSYREISQALGVPENSVGPTLSRAREKLRRLHADQPAS